jgi:hypothetical protein
MIDYAHGQVRHRVDYARRLCARARVRGACSPAGEQGVVAVCGVPRELVLRGCARWYALTSQTR